MTNTLYDLLGALPQDDAEQLRTAFRSAVKGAHPDLNPDDPDAALKFRRIIRAHEIVSDDDQRAVYDHLLDLAHVERQSASHRAIASKVHKLASGTLALVGLSVLAIGSYLLSMHISAVSISSPVQTGVTTGPSGITRLVSEQADIADNGNTAPMPASVSEPSAMTQIADVTEVAVGVPACTRVQDVYADRNDMLKDALAELEQAREPDLGLPPAYIDRNIVFYRATKSDPAFADPAQPKRIDKSNRPKPAATSARRELQRGDASTMPFFVQLPGEQDQLRRQRFAFSRMR